MQTLFLERLFSGQFIQAISWTLIHSLWQGLILALIAAAIILFTRRSRPEVRYNLLLLVFFSQLIASGVTLYAELKAADEIVIAATSLPVSNIAISTIENFAAEQLTFTDRLTIFFDNNAPVIVSIWMFVMSIMFVRMLAGITHLHKLKHVDTVQPADYWKQHVQQLAEKLNIRRPVIFLESGLAKVPMVIGYFKPVILVPLGLLANLPPKQVEAILSHELAHIRREDYIVNILQSIAETLFFFNPAIWWISSLIRDEREHCCDDVAVNSSTDKRTLVEALVAFQEYKLAGNAYAPAFAASKYKLLQRAKRIFNNTGSPLDPFVRTILTGCIVMASFSIFAFTDAGQSPVNSLNTDTIPGRQMSELDLMKSTDDAKYTPAEKVKIKKIREEITKLDAEIKKEDGPLLNDLLSRRHQLLAVIDEMRSPGESKEALEADHRSDKMISESDSKKALVIDAKINAADNAATTDQQKSMSDEQRQKAMLEQQKKNGSAEDNSDEEIRKASRAQEQKNAEFFSSLISDLTKESIISTTDGLSFMLSNSQFIVNGTQLSADVQKKFADKFLENKKATIVYRYKDNSIGWINR
ncbi:MAG: M56 family metallopeptidase [Chitinophagaceae bacterium]